MNRQEYVFCATLRHQEDCMNPSRNQGIRASGSLKEDDTVALRRSVSRKIVIVNCYPVLKIDPLWAVEIPQFAPQIIFTSLHRGPNGLV